MSTQGRSVHSVEKAITLLDCFWKSGSSLSLTELVQQTGWAKSTVHGLLASMLESAVVEQDKTDGRYRLGYHLYELGSCVSASWDVVGVVRPHLEELAARIGESTYLARLSGEELILVECVEPRKAGFRVYNEPGTRIPLHCSSQGKCILAHLDEQTARNILEHKGMHAYTPSTITTWEGIASQLELTRELGYSVERGEYRVGLQSVGAPIFSSTGTCEYAIGIVGIQGGGSLSADRKVIDGVRMTARQASFDLGWRGDETGKNRGERM